MKKRAFMLVGILLISIVMSACSSNSKSTTNENETTIIQAEYPVYDTAEEIVDASDLVFSGTVTEINYESLNVKSETGADSETGLVEATEIPYTIFDISIEIVLSDNSIKVGDILEVQNNSNYRFEVVEITNTTATCISLETTRGLRKGEEVVLVSHGIHVEYSDKVLSYKFVSSLEEAIEHINEFSSGHTESILTEDENNAKIFMNAVDSAGVYHNVSTRFADGFRYGFGAEVGISTNKTHARGPVGLEGLTIYKYNLEGNGDIVKDYVEGVKKFNHKDI